MRDGWASVRGGDAAHIVRSGALYGQLNGTAVGVGRAENHGQI